MNENNLNTRFGFEWGPVCVERICNDKTGYYIEVITDKQTLDIRITPSGIIKAGIPNKIIHSKNKENAN